MSVELFTEAARTPSPQACALYGRSGPRTDGWTARPALRPGLPGRGAPAVWEPPEEPPEEPPGPGLPSAARAAEGGGRRWPRRRGPPSSSPTWGRLRDYCRGRPLLLSSPLWTLPHWSASPPPKKKKKKELFFSPKEFGFRVCVIKSEFAHFYTPSSSSIPPFFFPFPF